MQAPTGDQTNRTSVVGGYGTTGSTDETEATETDEEHRQRARPMRNQKEGGGGDLIQKPALTAHSQWEMEKGGPDRQRVPPARSQWGNPMGGDNVYGVLGGNESPGGSQTP